MIDPDLPVPLHEQLADILTEADHLGRADRPRAEHPHAGSGVRGIAPDQRARATDTGGRGTDRRPARQGLLRPPLTRLAGADPLTPHEPETKPVAVNRARRVTVISHGVIDFPGITPSRASNQGNGKRAMALDVSDVREIVERVCARPDVLEACGNRDLGVVIEVLGAHGVTQGQIAGLTGISQGRLSEYKKHKRRPKASSIFEAFADGLGMPSAARQALGLSPDPAVAERGARCRACRLLTSAWSIPARPRRPREPGPVVAGRSRRRAFAASPVRSCRLE